MRTRVTPIVLLAFAAVVASAAPAAAQVPPPPQTPATSQAPVQSSHGTEVSGGYSFLYENGVGGASGNKYPWGWVGTINQRISGPFWAVGEVTGNYRKDSVTEEWWQLYGYFGGVRFNFFNSGTVILFGQGLFGGENFRAPGFSENGFAFQPGGGLDFGGSESSMKFRLQGDFRVSHQKEEDTNFKEFRLAASVVFGFK